MLRSRQEKPGDRGPSENGNKPWFYQSVPIAECTSDVQPRLSAAKVYAPQKGQHGQTIVLIP